MSKHKQEPRITNKEAVHSGKWLTTNIVHYTDADGKERQWESVARATRIDPETSDAVAIIAVLKRSLHHDCFVMVEQFRPPMGCHTLEFPAGLIDKCDNGAEGAALRELHEETGYRGKVKDLLGQCPAPLDPGILETTMSFIRVDIDGDSAENANHRQHLDDAEQVDVILFPVNEFNLQELSNWCKDRGHKVLLDSRVQAYALGLQMATRISSKMGRCFDMNDSPSENIK